MEQKQKDRLHTLIRLHNEFSRAYKAVEPIVEKMDAVTLNDARYALRAFVDCIQHVLSDQTNPDQFEQSASATELALRIAWHDVVDITFDSFQIYLDELGEKYGPDIVAKHIDISACSELLTMVSELVEQSRGDRNLRYELYSKITNDHLQKLKKLFNAAKAAEPAIASAFKKERRDSWLKYFGAVASLLILATILYVNFIKPDTPSVKENVQIEQSGSN